MIKKDARTALRLPYEQRQMIDELVRAGKFRNLSEVIRQALSEFLKQN